PGRGPGASGDGGGRRANGRRRLRTADRRGRGGGLVSAFESDAPAPFGLGGYWICLRGIVWREGLRFLHQRERFVSALVRPLVWLFIFAAGFRSVLGVSIIPPYDTYV